MGLLLTALGLTMLSVSFSRGFDWVGTTILTLCLIVGIILITRSLSEKMSRKDKINDMDERSRLIALKSAGAAFRWAEVICAVLLAVCLLGHNIIGEVLSVPMAWAFGIMFFTMLFLELAAVLYYERI
ncbi:hypothetical protein [Methanimicrococcus hacksteinii]|nr:hypothetical protein [Methanimicrococcus sp. At1]